MEKRRSERIGNYRILFKYQVIERQKMPVFKKNELLALDCLTLLNKIKKHLETILRLNFLDIEEETMPLATTDEIESNNLTSMISILNEATKKAYKRIRTSLLTQYSLTKDQMPSYYFLTKTHPKVLGFILQASLMHKDLDQDMKEASNAIKKIFLIFDMKHSLHYKMKMSSKMN